MTEVWKQLIHDEIQDGFELSTLGRIRSSSMKDDIYEASYHSTNGYDFAMFLLKFNNSTIQNIRQKLFPIDELIALTFIPVPNDLIGKQLKVIHIDGNTRNNVVDNLQWVEDVEEWRHITYYNRKYKTYYVSNYGRIMNKNGRIIKLTKNHSGYMVFNISNYDNSQTTVYVHRIVAYEFIGHNDNNLDVNHIDGDKTNNHIKNLEYVSKSDNMKHAFITRLNSNIGEGHFMNKISEEEIRIICQLLVNNKGSIQRTINELLKLDHDFSHVKRWDIERLKYKKTWVWVSDDYFTIDSFK